MIEKGSITVPWHRKLDAPYKASVPGLYFHESRAQVKLFGGAVGGTKTTTLATDVLYLSLQYPNNRGFCGERDFDDLRRGLYTEVLEWLPEPTKLADGRDLYQHHKSEHWIKFYNGSEIHFVELKDEPRNVNLGWFAIDQAERVPEKSFEWATTRLRMNHVPYRPLMMSANPEPGWLHRKIVRDSEPVNTGIIRRTGAELIVYEKGDYLFIPSFPEDNEHLPDGYIDNMYKTLSPTRVERLLRGIWETVEGAIYDQLDREHHLVALPEKVFWSGGAIGVDYGEKHLSAVVAIQRDLATGNYWVRACWVDRGGDAKRIEDAARGYAIHYDLRQGRVDPIQNVLAQNLGFNVAKKGGGSREQRISFVTRLLNADSLFFDVDGPGVRDLFEEMMAYRRERQETELVERDVVVRKDDDRVAALEYAIEELSSGMLYTPPATRTIRYERRPARALRPGQQVQTAVGYRIGRRS